MVAHAVRERWSDDRPRIKRRRHTQRQPIRYDRIRLQRHVGTVLLGGAHRDQGHLGVGKRLCRLRRGHLCQLHATLVHHRSCLPSACSKSSVRSIAERGTSAPSPAREASAARHTASAARPACPLHSGRVLVVTHSRKCSICKRAAPPIRPLTTGQWRVSGKRQPLRSTPATFIVRRSRLRTSSVPISSMRQSPNGCHAVPSAHPPQPSGKAHPHSTTPSAPSAKRIHIQTKSGVPYVAAIRP